MIAKPYLNEIKSTISTDKVSMNKKVFWISAGVAFVIATLAIPVKNNNNSHKTF